MPRGMRSWDSFQVPYMAASKKNSLSQRRGNSFCVITTALISMTSLPPIQPFFYRNTSRPFLIWRPLPLHTCCCPYSEAQRLRTGGIRYTPGSSRQTKQRVSIFIIALPAFLPNIPPSTALFHTSLWQPQRQHTDNAILPRQRP